MTIIKRHWGKILSPVSLSPEIIVHRCCWYRRKIYHRCHCHRPSLFIGVIDAGNKFIASAVVTGDNCSPVSLIPAKNLSSVSLSPAIIFQPCQRHRWTIIASINDTACLAPMVWAFLSATVQLPATQRKVEGEEGEIQLINMNEASSCLARGYCVPCSSRMESSAYQGPPPPPPTHSPLLNLNSFQWPRPKERTASI